MKGLGTRLLSANALLLILVPIVLLVLPRFVGNTPLLRVIAFAGLYVMWGASWDILSGYTGQVNFGHAAFIGFGAYTVAMLDKYQPGITPELGLLLAVATSAALGLAIGIPCLRLQGPYLALATLSLVSALVSLSFIYKRQTGGEDGIPSIAGFDEGVVTGPIGEGLAKAVLGPLTFGSSNGLDQKIYVGYYVILVAMVLVVGGLMLLGYGKRGLVLRSIQQDETAAEAAGVPVTRYKLGAFVLSAACAGFAGGLYAHFQGSVALNLLSTELSLFVIIVAALGGAGTIIGPAVGAYVVILLNSYYLDKIHLYEEHPELKAGTFALILIVVLIVQPRGLVPPVLTKLSVLKKRPAALTTESSP